jgi:hypothetical protein
MQTNTPRMGLEHAATFLSLLAKLFSSSFLNNSFVKGTKN